MPTFLKGNNIISDLTGGLITIFILLATIYYFILESSLEKSSI